MVKKILFITLSNIGDVILTLPVLDSLREAHPEAKITVMVGPRPKEIFKDDPNINRLIVYDKRSRLRDKIKIFGELKKERYDLVVDLRNSFFGAFLPARYRTSPFRVIPNIIKHMRDRHLYKSQVSSVPSTSLGASKCQVSGKNSLYIRPQDQDYIKNILKENNIKDQDKIVVVAAGARSHLKTWPQNKFVELISKLIKEIKVKVILVGDKDDFSINKYITEHLSSSLLNLSGKTSIAQLAHLLTKARLLITNDSAVLHLGSYLSIPVVAIFGPTNEEKYGPWSKTYAVVKRDIFCRPCEKAQCRFGTLDCMKLIKTEQVFSRAKEILTLTTKYETPSRKNDFMRILIVRTDRIGDVLLSSPVIKAFRDNYPEAYIAMMVSPFALGIVEGNPYLDEVIIYDKRGRHQSWLGSIKFALNLKKKRFNLAIILHPTNRAHLVTFLAGIRRRIGYDRKFGFLLTDKVKHTKQFGEKHELEYNLDLVRYLGIEPKDKTLYMSIKPESDEWAKKLFRQESIGKADKLLAIHPGASCRSKIWPKERFSEVADKLIEKYGFKVLIIAGAKDAALAQLVLNKMRHKAVNLAGVTSVSQLASLLKRCQLFISNDSGPVHIATAVGTPVISIFGRKQKGLSPKRWRPVGVRDQILHKEVGCIECLAHNCAKDFACLKAITVQDILNVVDSVLEEER